MNHSETKAVCRGCGLELKGGPYHKGGQAHHPRTGKQCPVNHYGGFVCSRECDWRASVEQVASMPGCGSAKLPDCYAAERIKRNWPEV